MTEPSLRRPKLLVIGDAMLDREWRGVVERISPEAPVPIVRATEATQRLGGAAAVAAWLANVECEVAFIGCVGDDAAGEETTRLLHAAGVRPRLVVERGRRTTVKTRIVADHRGRRQPVLRIDDETTTAIDEATRAGLLAAVLREVADADVVLVSDYGKGVVTPELFAGLLNTTRPTGTPVLVDPAKGKPVDAFRGATLVKVNRLEAAAATGHEVETPAQALEAAHALRERLGGAAVIVTLDRDGAVLVDEHGEAAFPAATQRVEDVTGAGDSVLAALGFAAAMQRSRRDGLRVAMECAARRIQSPSGDRLTKAELLVRLDAGEETAESPVSSYSRDELSPVSHKLILSHSQLAGRLTELRRAGRHIVFTNGCFDLLHVGHLATLQAARASGDALVVAINSDASVARLKGLGRPIMPECERAALLAALECVDWVTVFDDDTPEELISRLRPDVLIKGGDYRAEQIAGGEFVSAHRGRVLVAPLVAERSTTRLAARLGLVLVETGGVSQPAGIGYE